MKVFAVVGLITLSFFMSPLHAQYGVLTLSAGKTSGKPGTIVCVNVNAAGMRKIISMQYSLKWDSSVLELTEVKNFRLPGLTMDNFGRTQAAAGILTSVWIDNTLKGVELPAGTSLYQLCFRIKGKVGTSSALSFVQKPTPFEVINSFEQFIQLSGVSGKVTVVK